MPPAVHPQEGPGSLCAAVEAEQDSYSLWHLSVEIPGPHPLVTAELICLPETCP